ncbi:MAG: hypothetical protein JO051_03300 [Acidobacteriaceae bacterium]|nr:hypothetical protein [Acidobacteriaceae bacterium]
MKDNRRYTSDEITKAAALRQQGFKWRTIAVRFGRDPVSMRQHSRRAKKPIDHRHAENEALVAEFEAGKTVAEIAATRGWSWSRLHAADACWHGRRNAPGAA